MRPLRARRAIPACSVVLSHQRDRMNTIDGPGEMFSGNAESMNTVMVFALGMTMGLRSAP